MSMCIFGADSWVKQMMTEEETTMYSKYHKYDPVRYSVALILHCS